jgi:uncharacterized protein (TIGR02001 family)
MIKKFLLSTLALCAFAVPFSAANAAEPFGPGAGTLSGNVGVFSDYRFRGISQSDEGPALQGGLDYNHDAGLYLGVWGSSVDFNDGDEANLELDAYGGWNFDVGFGTFTVGGIYYWYPSASDDLNYDYFEVMAKLAHDFGFMSGSVSLNYSDNYFADSGQYFYPAVDVTVPLPKDFSLVGHLGYNSIDEEDKFGSPDYVDYIAGVGYKFYGVDLSLQYIGSDLDDDDCVDGCGDAVVFGVKKTF